MEVVATVNIAVAMPVVDGNRACCGGRGCDCVQRRRGRAAVVVTFKTL